MRWLQRRRRIMPPNGVSVGVMIRIVWTICFLIGASTHARDILNYGWLPYTYMPLPFNLFWTALFPLDLLAALLIWIKPRLGALLGLVIMLTDVVVNSWTYFGAGINEMLFPLLWQALFMLFVISTFGHVAKEKKYTWGNKSNA